MIRVRAGWGLILVGVLALWLAPHWAHATGHAVSTLVPGDETPVVVPASSAGLVLWQGQTVSPARCDVTDPTGRPLTGTAIDHPITDGDWVATTRFDTTGSVTVVCRGSGTPPNGALLTSPHHVEAVWLSYAVPTLMLLVGSALAVTGRERDDVSHRRQRAYG